MTPTDEWLKLRMVVAKRFELQAIPVAPHCEWTAAGRNAAQKKGRPPSLLSGRPSAFAADRWLYGTVTVPKIGSDVPQNGGYVQNTSTFGLTPGPL